MQREICFEKESMNWKSRISWSHILCNINCQANIIFILHSLSIYISGNPKQSTQAPIFIRILDINDHAPEFAKYYETFVCENAKAGQVNIGLLYPIFLYLVPSFLYLGPGFKIFLSPRNLYTPQEPATFLITNSRHGKR